MQGGENLAQIDLLHAFSDNDEQKISKEVLSMVETFSDMRHLPNIKDSMHLLAEEFKKAGINKDDKTVDVSTAVKMSEKIVHSTQFHELYESLSVNGKMDKNTLVIVLVMLSKGELEDKLQVLFSLIAHEEEDHAGPSRKSKSKKKMVVTRGRVEDTGNVSLSCLIMMNLAIDPFRESRFALALFDPQIIMLVGKSHLDRAISDVCDRAIHHHDAASSSSIDFNEFVQICLNVFYNLVEASTMKVLETPLRSRNDPVLRRFTDDGLETTMEERQLRRMSAETSQVSTPNIGYGDPLLMETTPDNAEILHRKSLQNLAEDMADTAADEAREVEDADHHEPPATLAGLISDFGLRLFFLSGVRFALALVFLAANASLVLVLVNRFDYTVEVALGFALLFDLGVAMMCSYLASRLKKLEHNLAMLNDGEGGETDLGDLPEEIDSIVPGLGKLLPGGLGFLTGKKYQRSSTTPRKKQEKAGENGSGGSSFLSSIKGFFGGGKDKPGSNPPGGLHNRGKRNSQSFTEMDFTPFKGQMRIQTGGGHSRQSSAEHIV